MGHITHTHCECGGVGGVYKERKKNSTEAELDGPKAPTIATS